jgi:hypothetical protein
MYAPFLNAFLGKETPAILYGHPRLFITFELIMKERKEYLYDIQSAPKTNSLGR